MNLQAAVTISYWSWANFLILIEGLGKSIFSFCKSVWIFETAKGMLAEIHNYYLTIFVCAGSFDLYFFFPMLADPIVNDVRPADLL